MSIFRRLRAIKSKSVRYAQAIMAYLFHGSRLPLQFERGQISNYVTCRDLETSRRDYSQMSAWSLEVSRSPWKVPMPGRTLLGASREVKCSVTVPLKDGGTKFLFHELGDSVGDLTIFYRQCDERLSIQLKSAMISSRELDMVSDAAVLILEFIATDTSPFMELHSAMWGD